VDLAQARGFRYFVVLDELPEFSRPNQGSNWDTVVGFTNNPDADIAREFPEYYNPRLQYVVQPADLRELFSQASEKPSGK